MLDVSASSPALVFINFIEAIRVKEIQRLLKFGRDSNWPLAITVSSTIDGSNSISVTYSASWDDCNASAEWFCTQFEAIANQDGLIGLPVMSRNHSWLLSLRKEDNSMREILHEKSEDGTLVSTPEDDGIPCFLLYGPRAAIKMRCESVDVANHYLTMIYNAEPVTTEILQTAEWALVAAINGGSIPLKHRVTRDQGPVVNPSEWNIKTREAALFTQDYDKGFDRFVGKFDPRDPLSSVITIEKGVHFDHGAAIYFTQGKRRCLLLDTLYGLSDDEALWYTLQSWAKFQPRLMKPRTSRGQLYYPAEHTHVFEKYWDYLHDPLTHPDCSESEFTKASMSEFAAALSQMDLSLFEPSVDSEAREKSCRVAQQAALSRRCIVQDAIDYWNQREAQERMVTGSGASAPS
jgi:hypothetical protein